MRGKSFFKRKEIQVVNDSTGTKGIIVEYTFF